MTTKKDVVKTVTATNAPLELISQAVAAGADVETLERLMDLSERYEANEARRAYEKSMAAFQNECPAIVKNRKAAHHKYAPLEDLQLTAGPVLASHGLSVTFTMDREDGMNVSVCTVRHELGHHEQTRYPVIMPKLAGGANDAQLMAAANSYAIRNNYRNALNLRVIGEDDDSGGKTELISADQAANIQALMEEVGADKKAFLQWRRVDSISEIPVTFYKQCITMLERKRNVS